jgi:HrpA-like RNA helicase
LHGGLDLKEQHRAFERTPQRKVILATNVAETSLTIPGIGVVIDSGLVRQSRYQAGRGFLTLMPIAADSAAQRAGRAGRTAAGVCYRLWNAAAQLSPTTVPEIHRESLVPLVLTAAAWGKRVEDLQLLDAPKPYALEAARVELRAWGALQGDAALSERGRDLFVTPIEPAHARLLSEAKREGCLDDMIDLVSVLSVGRPLFPEARTDVSIDADLRRMGCDVSAAILALHAAKPEEHGASSFVVRESRLIRARLRRQYDLREMPKIASRPAERHTVERDALIRAVLAADMRLAHVARVRGRQMFFSNGGTEIELARESAVQNVKDVAAILALDTRAFGTGRDSRVLVTCAMAVPLSVLARTGLGSDRTLTVKLERQRVSMTVERVYAGCVLGQRDEEPRGERLHEALLALLLRGSLFRNEVNTTRERLVHLSIAAWLATRGQPPGARRDKQAPPLEKWLAERVTQLGIESNDDLPLLSGRDFLASELPYESRSAIESDYPLSVNVAGTQYRAEYDLEQGQVTLLAPKGARAEPPGAGYLPKFPGLRILVEGPRGITVVRARG